MMTKKLISIVLLLIVMLLGNLHAQNCLNSAGEPVLWWVVLKVPPTIGNSGYGYYDSNMLNGQFLFTTKTIDLDVSPLTQTFSLINKEKLERVAWNDEKPNNQTSSTLAHSKGLIAYNKATGRGFYVLHSIPKYPAFLEDHTINTTIGNSQQVYGQHIACFSLSLYELNNIALNLQVTHPYIYETMVTTGAPIQHIYDLAHGATTVTSQQFKYYQMKPTGYSLKAIYKNNNVNGSIFEDGLVKWLKDGKITAETWGRPLQTAWCWGGLEVNNVKQIVLSPSISWNESADHSKWALGQNKYSCFGDMNRMTSQWKRGGSFYCLESPSLHSALKKIVVVSDSCLNTNQSRTERLFNLQSQ